jgi:hypothetical protein
MPDRVASARATLREIVEKLEPLEKDLLSFAPGGFVDPLTRKFAREVQERERAGLVLLRTALLRARRALQSDDPNLILDAEGDCQTLFSDGRMLYFRHITITEPRRVQGRRSGAIRKAADVRVPYVSQYHTLVEGGMPYLQARIRVIDEAKAGGVKFPESRSSLNRWFPKQKNVSRTGSRNK